MTRGRIALLLFVPALILLAGELGSHRAALLPGAQARSRLESRAEAVGRHLDALLADARRVAERARDAGPAAARDGIPAALADRLEGAGVLRSARFESWTGTPAEASSFGEAGSARIAASGMRTSLLVSSAPDPAGRVGVASFALDVRAGGAGASELLVPAGGGIAVRWSFDPTEASAEPRFAPGPPASLHWPFRAGRAAPLATIVLEESPAGAMASRVFAIACAWAALAFAVLVALLLARRPAPVDTRRFIELTVGVIAARVALLAGRSFEELLPRSVGSPSLYGRGDGFGLFASPAALFVTAACAALLLTAFGRTIADRASRRSVTAWLAALGATLAACVGIVLLASSLARDARVRVPRLDPSSLGILLLALSAACLIAGTAELAATVVDAARSGGAGGARPGRLAVAVALVPLALLFLFQLYRTSDRVVDERLRSEFAPLVLEQSARRRVALAAAIGQSATSPRVAAALARAPSSDDAFLAYDLWVDSDLFHEGFASSIDLYDAAGNRRGQFGFGFPQVGGDREAVVRATQPGAAPVVEAETVPAGASQLRVVHGEAAVAGPSGSVAGRVVGHVLDDPSNLPFLPANAPYIEALGGSPQPSDTPSTEAPDYVLFDEDGRVALSTVRQPPAATPALRTAASAGRLVKVTSGDASYRALPLAQGGRLHLLLIPAPTVLGALADAIRLLLAGLAVVAAAGLGTTVAGKGAPAVFDVVRGSFYRRLLATVLLASIVPLVALSFFLRAYIDRRSEASLADAAAALVGAARRVVEDYQSVGEDDPTIPRLRINDDTLWWLRRVVGQEIHVYEDGVLAATSKPELFDSALLRKRLPGEVDRDVVRGGQPFVVRRERLGTLPLPVAYARVDEPGGPKDAVIAVPLVIEQRASTRSVDRIVEMLLLLTTALVLLLAAGAAWIARSVAGPVRRLADASRRIAGGDYGTRLTSTSRDEMGSLVSDFNRMAGALAGQRADLERRRDYIEALLRHATTGVVSTDAEGVVVTINPAAAGLLAGDPGPPRRGERLPDALAANARLAPLAEALSGPAPDAATPLEVDLDAGDGPVRLRLVRVPLPDPFGGRPGTLILLDDVTSLMKSNQLAAWAEMARAIAHEIKNPLTPIQLSTEHVRKLLNDRGILPVPEIDACLDTIVRNVRELRDISAAFSTYAKIPDLTLARIDPASFLREIAAPYRAAPPAHVRIEERHEGAPQVLADARVLARAIVNLIENAIQAMPAGGTLTLASSPGDAGFAVLEVKDTGEGMTPEARARLFTPYFSTKSSGTGLGLAIVRRVVLGHGGSIEVESTRGQGTTFRIRLKEAPGADILRA